MTGKEYQSLAKRTISKDRTKDEMLLNGAMGLCGESGEVMELLKKQLFHNKPFSKENMILELGDVAWYLAEMCTALDITLDDIFEANIEKLKQRYPDGFHPK